MRLRIYSKWYKSVSESFLKLLEYNPTARVVDLGCGSGDFASKVKERIGCNHVMGVDVYEPFFKEMKNKGLVAIKHDLNVFPYPFESVIDVVVSNQVIEHLFSPTRFMEEIYRILKLGGYAVISTENLASWDNIGALFLGYTPFSQEYDKLYQIGNPLSLHDGELIGDSFQPHVRIFSFRGLVDLASFVGFKLEEVVGSGHILFKLGEVLDKRHCRWITIKLRKEKSE